MYFDERAFSPVGASLFCPTVPKNTVPGSPWRPGQLVFLFLKIYTGCILYSSVQFCLGAVKCAWRRSAYRLGKLQYCKGDYGKYPAQHFVVVFEASVLSVFVSQALFHWVWVTYCFYKQPAVTEWVLDEEIAKLPGITAWWARIHCISISNGGFFRMGLRRLNRGTTKTKVSGSISRFLKQSRPNSRLYRG